MLTWWIAIQPWCVFQTALHESFAAESLRHLLKCRFLDLLIQKCFEWGTQTFSFASDFKYSNVWEPGEGNGTPLQYSCLENPMEEEPGGLQSMGSLRVRHDWATSLLLFTFMHWRRKWQPTPVFLPGESQGQRSLVGCHLWGCTELDTTEAT